MSLNIKSIVLGLSVAAAQAAAALETAQAIHVAPYYRHPSSNASKETQRGWIVIKPTKAIELESGDPPYALPKGLQASEVNLVKVDGPKKFEADWRPDWRVHRLDAETLRPEAKDGAPFPGFKQHKAYIVTIGARKSDRFVPVWQILVEPR
jgi:hypothetical protein